MPDTKPSPRFPGLDRRIGAILAASGGSETDELMTTRQVAEFLGMSCEWLEFGRMPRYGKGPTDLPFIKLAPQCVRYRREDVLAWLERRAASSQAA